MLRARLRLRRRHPDLGHRLRDPHRHVQPRRHRRRLRRGLRAPVRPRAHPVPLGECRRPPRRSTSSPRSCGSPATTRGAFDWLVGFYYFDENLKAETFSYDSPDARQPAGRLRLPEAGRRLAGPSSARSTSGRRTAGRSRRGLRYTTDKKDFSAERPDPTFQLPTVAPDRGLDRRGPRHLGPLGHLQGDRERQPLRPRRHRLPRALDPGAHPLLRRLRGRPEPGDELRVGRRRGEDHLVRGRGEDDPGRPQAAPQPRRLRLPGRRPADHRGRRPVQHRDAAQRRQDRRATASRPTSTGRRCPTCSSPWAPATTTPRSTTRTSRWRRAAAAARSPTRRRRTGARRRQPPAARPEVDLQRHRRLPADRWSARASSASLDWAYHSEKSFFLYQSKEFHGDSFELGARVGLHVLGRPPTRSPPSAATCSTR